MSQDEEGAFEDFLREVGHGIDTHTSRMRDDILRMFSLHLQQQRLAMRESARQASEQRERELEKETAESVASRRAAQLEASNQRAKVRRLAAALGEAHRRHWLQRRFRDWANWRRRRRWLATLRAAMGHLARTTRVYHIYTQWRLFAAARRQQGLAAAELAQWRIREAELMAEVQTLREVATGERRRSEGLEEKMRAAFVRGVCALNREAVQVLRGAEGEDDELPQQQQQQPQQLQQLQQQQQPQQQQRQPQYVSAQQERPETYPPQQQRRPRWQEPLSHEESRPPQPTSTPTLAPHPQRPRASPLRPATAAPTASASAPLPPGPPCHVCYAPSTCPYSPTAVTRQPPPHQPFVVSVDPTAAPSYGAAPSSHGASHFGRPPARTERLRR